MKLGFDFGTCTSHIQWVNGTDVQTIVSRGEHDAGKPSEYLLGGFGNGFFATTDEKLNRPQNLVTELKLLIRNQGVNYKPLNGSPTIGEIVKGFLGSFVEYKQRIQKQNGENPEIEVLTITMPVGSGKSIAKAQYASLLKTYLSESLNLNQEKIHTLEEPVAGAFSYTRYEKVDKNLLIFDLGGGTLDVAYVRFYLEKGKQCYQILDKEGDDIGANQWDIELKNLVIDEINKKGFSFDENTLTNKEKMMFKNRINELKHSLSSLEAFSFDGYPFGLDSVRITRKAFESRSGRLLQKAMKVVDKIVGRLEENNNGIDEVVLVGGGSCMPQIQKAMEGRFGKVVISNPLYAIAKGAAIYSKLVSQGKIGSMVQQCTSHAYGTDFLADDGTRKIDIIIAKNQEFSNGKNIKSESFNYVPHDKDQDEIPCCLFEIDDANLRVGAKIPLEEGRYLNQKMNVPVPKHLYTLKLSRKYSIALSFELTPEGELTMIACDSKTGKEIKREKMSVVSK